MNWEFLNEKWVLLFEIGPGKSVVPSQHGLWLSWALVWVLFVWFWVLMYVWAFGLPACLASQKRASDHLELELQKLCMTMDAGNWTQVLEEQSAFNHWTISSALHMFVLLLFVSVTEPKVKNLHLNEANKTVRGSLELAYPTPSLRIWRCQQFKRTCHFTLKICGSTVISQKVTSVFKLFIKNFGWSYVSYGSNRVQPENPSTKEDSALRKERSVGMCCQWGRTNMKACMHYQWLDCLSFEDYAMSKFYFHLSSIYLKWLR